METSSAPAHPVRPRSAVFVLLAVALAAVALGGYQWFALYEMRASGATPGCAISEAIDCVSVWNSPLAGVVHRYSGLPFAGWGVVWGLVLLALASTLALRQRSAHATDDIVGAARLATAAGAAVSVALLIYSLVIGVFCPTCVLFYVLVAVAMYIAFARLPRPAGQWGAAMLHGGGWVLVSFGALLYLGLQTPREELAAAVLSKLPPPAATTDLASDPLANFITSLDPEMQQTLSDVRALYRTAPYIEPRVDRNRVVFGNPQAPVHLVDWVDIRCPHCRNLDLALEEIQRVTPPSAWSEEARHFPLDSECNRNVQRSDGSGTACLSAKLLICLAGSPRGNGVRHELFANQRELTRERVWEIAAPEPAQRAALEACVNANDTAVALQRDIQLAMQHRIDGTPLVVINGREAPAFPPFIYAMIIAGGDSNAAGFGVLPPPRPEALER